MTDTIKTLPEKSAIPINPQLIKEALSITNLHAPGESHAAASGNLGTIIDDTNCQIIEYCFTCAPWYVAATILTEHGFCAATHPGENYHADCNNHTMIIDNNPIHISTGGIC